MPFDYPIKKVSLTDNNGIIVATSFQVLMPKPEEPRHFNNQAEADAYQRKKRSENPNKD